MSNDIVPFQAKSTDAIAVAADLRLDALASRVRAEHAAVLIAGRTVLAHAMATGDLLLEAQSELKHGEWLPWLKSTGVPERTAQRYIRLAEHRAEIEAKSDTVSDLTLTAALNLIAKPAPQDDGPKLNAIGRPFSPSYDPNYKMRHTVTPISRLRKRQNFPWVGEGNNGASKSKPGIFEETAEIGDSFEKTGEITPRPPAVPEPKSAACTAVESPTLAQEQPEPTPAASSADQQARRAFRLAALIKAHGDVAVEEIVRAIDEDRGLIEEALAHFAASSATDSPLIESIAVTAA